MNPLFDHCWFFEDIDINLFSEKFKSGTRCYLEKYNNKINSSIFLGNISLILRFYQEEEQQAPET